MTKVSFIILLVMSLLEICWPASRSTLREDFPVEICVIGQGSGFTCQNVLETIEDRITSDCSWIFRRSDQPGGHIMIGHSLNLNQDSEIGEYICLSKSNVTEAILFIMPIGKD